MALDTGIDASLTPYRQMDRFDEPSVADRMREMTEQTKQEKQALLVANILENIKSRAQAGHSSTSWPWQTTTRPSLQVLADILEEMGFTCTISPAPESVKWWRDTNPADHVWVMCIEW